MRTLLRLCFCLAVISAVLTSLQSDRTAVAGNGVPTEVPQGQLDFNGCVRLALRQSPYLTSSSLDIDLRKLDETDSRFGMFPTVSLRTRYYVNEPNFDYYSGDQKPYKLGFYLDRYNPIESYISLQANRLITQMAKLAHSMVITKYIQRLGGAFLELESAERLESVQKQVVETAERSLAYMKTRLTEGSVTSLEVQLAEHELELARVDLQGVEETRNTILDGIKGVLGLKSGEVLMLDCRNSTSQVLSGFDPAGARLDTAQSNSYDLMLQQLKVELQSKNILLARARYLPTFLAGIENPDPLSNPRNKDYYFYFGFEIPIWDGLQRQRNITRQQLLLKQFASETQTKEIDLAAAWRTANEKYQKVGSELRLARNYVEVASLKKRQAQIAYEQARQPYSSYLAEAGKLLDASKNSEMKEVEHAKAALAVYALSGELSRRFVAPQSF